MCFSKSNITLYDSLSRPLKLSTWDKSIWSDKCDYVDPLKCINLNPDEYNLVVMQLNIQGLLSHQTRLKHLLQILETRNSKVDAILLCKTFLTKITDKLVNISGYTLINYNRVHAKGGGVAILLRNDIPYKKRYDISVLAEKELESVYVEITAKNGSQILLGSLYHSLNSNAKPLTNHLEETINITRTKNPNTEIILGMDHNLDLLKCDTHKATENFLDLMINSEQWPTITWPTRIIQRSAMLIDNIFVSSKLHRNFDSMVILDDISDHLPTFVLLKQTKLCNKQLIEFQSRILMDKKFDAIRKGLNQVDWNGILNSDKCDTNFNTFCDILENKLDEVAPVKTIRISGKQCFQEP